jgi:hypothetical protein
MGPLVTGGEARSGNPAQGAHDFSDADERAGQLHSGLHLKKTSAQASLVHKRSRPTAKHVPAPPRIQRRGLAKASPGDTEASAPAIETLKIAHAGTAGKQARSREVDVQGTSSGGEMRIVANVREAHVQRASGPEQNQGDVTFGPPAGLRPVTTGRKRRGADSDKGQQAAKQPRSGKGPGHPHRGAVAEAQQRVCIPDNPGTISSLDWCLLVQSPQKAAGQAYVHPTTARSVTVGPAAGQAAGQADMDPVTARSVLPTQGCDAWGSGDAPDSVGGPNQSERSSERTLSLQGLEPAAHPIEGVQVPTRQRSIRRRSVSIAAAAGVDDSTQAPSSAAGACVTHAKPSKSAVSKKPRPAVAALHAAPSAGAPVRIDDQAAIAVVMDCMQTALMQGSAQVREQHIHVTHIRTLNDQFRNQRMALGEKDMCNVPASHLRLFSHLIPEMMVCTRYCKQDSCRQVVQQPLKHLRVVRIRSLGLMLPTIEVCSSKLARRAAVIKAYVVMQAIFITWMKLAPEEEQGKALKAASVVCNFQDGDHSEAWLRRHLHAV